MPKSFVWYFNPGTPKTNSRSSHEKAPYRGNSRRTINKIGLLLNPKKTIKKGEKSLTIVGKWRNPTGSNRSNYFLRSNPRIPTHRISNQQVHRTQSRERAIINTKVQSQLAENKRLKKKSINPQEEGRTRRAVPRTGDGAEQAKDVHEAAVVEAVDGRDGG